MPSREPIRVDIRQEKRDWREIFAPKSGFVDRSEDLWDHDILAFMSAFLLRTDCMEGCLRDVPDLHPLALHLQCL